MWLSQGGANCMQATSNAQPAQSLIASVLSQYSPLSTMHGHMKDRSGRSGSSKSTRGRAGHSQ